MTTNDISSVHRRASAPVVADYLLSHLGFFAVLPVLPLLVQRLHPGTSALFVGAALFVFNFAIRGASLFYSGVLQRSPVRGAMTGGLWMAAAGFALVPVAPGQVGIMLCLLLAGTGISTNGLVARVYVTLSLSKSADRNAVFSAVQVAVNVSAALGPIAANALLGRGFDVALMLAVAAMYVLASAVVIAAVPAGLRPGDGAVRPPLRLGLFRVAVADPEVRRASVITAVGNFLYAQFFSAVVLQVGHVTDSSTWRASFFTANAVLVVALQIPVTAYANRRLRAGTPPVNFLSAGVVAFCAAFAVMSGLGLTLAGVFVAVGVFSFAETVFTPMVNTTFTAIPGDRPVVELFNLQQVAGTAGESLGAFAGGALYLTAAQHGVRPLYWAALASAGVLSIAAYLRPRARMGVTQP